MKLWLKYFFLLEGTRVEKRWNEDERAEWRGGGMKTRGAEWRGGGMKTRGAEWRGGGMKTRETEWSGSTCYDVSRKPRQSLTKFRQ